MFRINIDIIQVIDWIIGIVFVVVCLLGYLAVWIHKKFKRKKK